jgi:hypothetical protein
MWEAIKDVLISTNGIFIACILLVLLLVVIILTVKMSKAGLLNIDTKHFKLSNKISDRELIRRQIEKGYDYVMSMKGKIKVDKDKEVLFDNILEKIYDKVIEWIIFNHITINQLYIQDKQGTILNLIYSLPISDKFKTPEFKQRVCGWVKELIEQLVCVKELYVNET